MNRIHKIALSGAIAITVGGGIVAASAATLGTISSTKLGSGDVAVGSCDSDGVSVSYTYAYNAAVGHQRYEVSAATVNSIASPACDSKNISVTLTGASGVNLDTSTAATVPVGASGVAVATVAFATPASAEAVQGASVVISG